MTTTAFQAKAQIKPQVTTGNFQTAYVAFANTIYDTQGLGRLIDQLSLIERSLFKEKQGMISAKARDYLTGNIISVFEDIEKLGLEPKDDKGQLQFLKDLTSYLEKLPRIKIIIAFAPTQSFIMRLNSQIADSLGSKVILDITVDEKVIAGAIFEFAGKTSDQTLQNKLQEVLVGLVEKTSKPGVRAES